MSSIEEKPKPTFKEFFLNKNPGQAFGYGSIGLLMLFSVGILMSYMNPPAAIASTVFLGGLFVMRLIAVWSFMCTKNILVPVSIHFIYNGIVLFGRSTLFPTSFDILTSVTWILEEMILILIMICGNIRKDGIDFSNEKRNWILGFVSAFVILGLIILGMVT